jgi:hypothetical protein
MPRKVIAFAPQPVENPLHRSNAHEMAGFNGSAHSFSTSG